MNIQVETPNLELEDAGRWFQLWSRGSSYLRLQPTLEGLQWILTRHYQADQRNLHEFTYLTQLFLSLQNVKTASPAELLDRGILTASDVILWKDKTYLISSDLSGISPFQKLGRDWYLDCQRILSEKEEKENE